MDFFDIASGKQKKPQTINPTFAFLCNDSILYGWPTFVITTAQCEREP